MIQKINRTEFYAERDDVLVVDEMTAIGVLAKKIDEIIDYLNRDMVPSAAGPRGYAPNNTIKVNGIGRGDELSYNRDTWETNKK